MKPCFVPDSFKVPASHEVDGFRLRMLSVEDAEKDYEAVIESKDLLRERTGGQWPREGFTLEENRADLARHQREFERREAFAYTVVSLDESRVLGCVYINPSPDPGADAAVHLWARKSEQENGLDQNLFDAVKRWLTTTWPFERIDYPGREPTNRA